MLMRRPYASHCRVIPAHTASLFFYRAAFRNKLSIFRDALMPDFSVAIIDEARCIGCTLCIDACPVDCIIGAQNYMHTIIADECIGCKLCVAPCPVDCISMIAATPLTVEQKQKTRERHKQKLIIDLRRQELRQFAHLQPSLEEKSSLLTSILQKAKDKHKIAE